MKRQNADLTKIIEDSYEKELAQLRADKAELVAGIRYVDDQIKSRGFEFGRAKIRLLLAKHSGQP